MNTAPVQMARLALQNLSPRERGFLIKEWTGAAAAPTPERLLRRAEVARRLSCSLRLVDLLAARGTLTRVRLPGRLRGHGFLESQVSALLAGGGGDAR